MWGKAFIIVFFFLSAMTGCKAQNKTQAAVRSNDDPPESSRPKRQIPGPYPVIPITEFTKTWIGAVNCSGKGDLNDTLVITLKDSSNVIVSGFYGYRDQVVGKIRGYNINIQVQDALSAGPGMTVTGRLVLSNDRQSLNAYFTMQRYDGADKCNGMLYRPK